jgi:hypothetical protein
MAAPPVELQGERETGFSQPPASGAVLEVGHEFFPPSWQRIEPEGILLTVQAARPAGSK